VDDRLKRAEDSLKDLVEQLGSWQRVKILASATAPILVGLALQFLNVGSLYEAIVKEVRSISLGGIAGISLRLVPLISYTVYLFIPFQTSFEYKRELFFPGVGLRELSPRQYSKRVERLRRKGIEPTFGQNVYALEDAIFRQLGYGKRREYRIDIFTRVLFFSLVLVVFAVASLSPDGAMMAWLLPLLCALFAWLIIPTFRARKYR
jgi:hypothetical protein